MRSTSDLSITVSSGAVLLLGLVVMLGWHFGVTGIVQLHPSFTPMQYNTAVCFVVAGFSAAFARSRSGISAVLAIAVTAIALVSLLQYTLGRAFGIDELLMPAYITAEAPHPGRMAPQTAICFVLAGSALAALHLRRAWPHSTVFAELLSSLIGGVCIAAVIGYSLGIEPAYGWAELPRVALHTALGLLVLSFAILQNAWRLRSTESTRALQLLAAPVAVAGLAVTLVLFQALSAWQVERIDAATARDVERATTALETRLRGYLRRFEALAQEWGRGDAHPQLAWDADVARFLRDEQVFLAISHGGADGKLDWIFPAGPYPDHLGLDYSAQPERSEWLEAARARGGAVLTPPLLLKSGRPGVLMVAPVSPMPGESAPFVVAAALLESLFSPTALAMPSYSLAVFEHERLAFGSAAAGGARTIGARDVHIDGASFRLAATPLPEAMAAARSPLPAVVLASGLLATLLLAVTAHLAQVSSLRAASLSSANRQLKAAKEKLERLALFDELTGLGNRNLLLMELDKQLDIARRESAPLPLLLIDLNGFKTVNDTFGHEAGDDVLREFAARLMDELPLRDEAFRAGGDEFAVLAKPGTSLDEALAIARAIERITQTPILVRGEQRIIGASIGIASYPHHGTERARLLRAADVAMYQAKQTSTGIQMASDETPTAVLRALKQPQGSGARG